MTVCLDSWAVLAWLDGDEPAASRVGDIIEDRPVISWVNLIEVYHRVERDHGRTAADEILAELRKVLDVELPGVVRFIETARLKAALPIALAGCFAVATATARQTTLWTGDPEMLSRSDLPCRVEDLS